MCFFDIYDRGGQRFRDLFILQNVKVVSIIHHPFDLGMEHSDAGFLPLLQLHKVLLAGSFTYIIGTGVKPSRVPFLSYLFP